MKPLLASLLFGLIAVAAGAQTPADKLSPALRSLYNVEVLGAAASRSDVLAVEALEGVATSLGKNGSTVVRPLVEFSDATATSACLDALGIEHALGEGIFGNAEVPVTQLLDVAACPSVVALIYYQTRQSN